MELAQILRALWARRLLTAAVVVVAVGATAAIKLAKHSVPTGTATAQILIDSPHSAIADLRQDPTPLTARASVIAQLMSSSLIEHKIATAARVPASQLTTAGPFSGPGLALDVVTPSEARGPQLTAEKVLYRLTFVPQQQLPLVTVSAQAPTPAAAGKLASAVYPAVTSYISSLQAAALQTQQRGQATTGGSQQGANNASNATIPLQDRVTLRQLGPVQTGSQNSGSALVLAMAAFLGLIILGFVGIVWLEAVRPNAVAQSTASPAAGRMGVEEVPALAHATDDQAAGAIAHAERISAATGSNGRVQDARTTSAKFWRAGTGL